jgi:peroxiredoxin
MSQPSPLTVAPPFELPTHLGEIRALDSLLQKRRLLLAFHRGTW